MVGGPVCSWAGSFHAPLFIPSPVFAYDAGLRPPNRPLPGAG